MVATRLARHSWLRPCSDAFALVELDPRRGAVDAVDGFRDLGLVDDQRWQHAHHIVSGRGGEQPLGTQCLDQLAVRADSEEPEQKALAAHLGDGLLLGLLAVCPNGELVEALRAERLLAAAAGDNVVRMLPPLIIDEPEIAEAINRIDGAAARIEFN